MRERAKMTTWRLGLHCWPSGRFSAPKDLPSNAHPHPFLCGDAYGAAFWALHPSCAQRWYLCYYSNSLGWFVLAFFGHVAQGMLGNAESSELSLYLRAGRTSRILNKHLHQFLQVNQESQPSSTLFQACKDFFFPSLPPSLRGSLYQNTAEIQDPSSASFPKIRGTKGALKTLNMQIVKCFHMQKNGCF